MPYHPAYSRYLEDRVLNATPVELVRILYHEALESVREARRHLREGDVPARARRINQAVAILVELATSVDASQGGELAAGLLRLYDYLLERLTQANLLQTEAALAEAENVLTTLTEAWDACPAPETVAV